MAKYDWTTPLPKNVCDGIFKYRIEYRQEKYQTILFDRYCYLQWFDEEKKDEVGCWYDPVEYRRFINRCCDVYMDD